MSMVFCLKYPVSRGSIHITSANDIYAPPDFDSGMFSNEIDILPHRWAYKKGREIMRRMTSFRGEWPPAHPQFSPDSDAAVKPVVSGRTVEDIVYTAEDDVAIDNWIRKMVQSMCHPMYVCYGAGLMVGELVL
jgi:alcohol oxidase